MTVDYGPIEQVAGTFTPNTDPELWPWAKHLEFDGEFHYRGVRWLHVKGGFGRGVRYAGRERGRTDWVADVPVSMSVSNHHGVGFAAGREGWGFYGDKTLIEELDATIEQGLVGAREKLRRAQALSRALEVAIGTTEVPA